MQPSLRRRTVEGRLAESDRVKDCQSLHRYPPLRMGKRMNASGSSQERHVSRWGPRGAGTPAVNYVSRVPVSRVQGAKRGKTSHIGAGTTWGKVSGRESSLRGNMSLCKKWGGVNEFHSTPIAERPAESRRKARVTKDCLKDLK